MKQHTKLVTLWVLLLTWLIMCLPVAGLAENAVPSLKDDFYTAVNAQWLAEAEIPGDRYSVGGFTDLAYDITDLLMADADKMVSGEITPDNDMLKEFAAFYAMAGDYEKRNEDGAEPLLPYLARIEALESLEDLNAQLPDWLLDNMALPFALVVTADMANAQENALYAVAPSVILPDVSYYDASNPYGPMLLDAFSGIVQQMMLLTGYSAEEAARIAEEALDFDALLVPYTKTAEEASDVKGMYNPQTLASFCEAYTGIDFAALVDGLVEEAPEQIIVRDPKFYAAFNEIITEENFPLLKSWMTAMTVYSLGGYLSDTLQSLYNSYTYMLTGQAEADSPERLAYTTASTLYGPVVGDYYGRAYFGQEAKDDVTAMVENMIAVYRQRLENNTWLSDSTREAAVRKLDHITIQVGYPDTINPLYETFIVTPAEEGGTLLGNAMAFSRLAYEDMFAKLGKPVDRDEWVLTADTVNAMYYMLTNTIMFPAAILQAPFYSLEQSASANYGGIGAVIAHEISHAFDPNGSAFDEYGNLANWWAQEDIEAFNALAMDMVTLFDGQEHAGGTVNGTLTASENIADAGGLSCALEVVKSLPDADLEAFFENWGVIWRVLYTPEMETMLLAVDNHAPNKLRANIQLSLVEEFYTTFDIQEGDGMYLAPEARVSIW